MIHSFSLLTFITLSVFSFGQAEPELISVDPATIQPLPHVISVEEFQKNYRGCTIPISTLSPSSCCAPIVRKVEESEDQALDITDPELAGLTASPNPTKGYLSVSIPPNLIGREIQIIDMTGRFVGGPVPITGTSVNLNIEGESGVYLLSIRTEKTVITERILLDK